MEFNTPKPRSNPAERVIKPRTSPAPIKGDIFTVELKKLYKEFKAFGAGEEQVMLINDPNGMMARFRYSQGEFIRFAKLFNKTAMENDVPFYIRLDRKTGLCYLCSKNEGSGLLGVF